MNDRPRWRFDIGSSLLTLVAVGVVSFGYGLWEHETAQPSKKKARSAPDLKRIATFKVGTDGTLSDSIMGNVVVGRSQDDYQAMTEAIDSGDDIGLREIVVSGRGFKVGNGNAVVLRGSAPFGVVEVQFSGGDHAGEMGWVSGDTFHASADANPAVASLNAPDTNGAADSNGVSPIGGP